ncbi:tripartite motif-containing protein 3-like [Branchiostoma floridae]|uniref:Tripartite motif-containing protein 3-like n=1 Tax=Branchiostoma floridae TaxID=7739 RepID=A0A9J7KKP5_BRAFL|nr:tripartite motif-containing protein 3-like [Branchiostoma floridae]
MGVATEKNRDHSTITLDDLKNPSNRQKYTRAEYCPKHTDQRMTFYCQPCAKPVCRDCTITEHRPGPNHDPQEVSKVAQEVKGELQTLVATAQDRNNTLKKSEGSVTKKLSSITTNCEQQKKNIQKHFAQLRAKLDEEEKELTKKLEEMEKSQKEPLLKELKDVGSNNPVLRFGQEGSQQGQFDRPIDVAVRGDRLYVADTEDNIIVTDIGNDRVQVFDKNLNFQHKFGQKGRHPQDMWGPRGVSADSRGNIVLANVGGITDGVGHSEKLQVFRQDGTWVSTIPSDGDKLNLPHGVAVTEDGHVFVADAEDHCIRKYRYM